MLQIIPLQEGGYNKKMGELAKKALKMLRVQGGRVIDTNLVERTLREIGKEYRPGLLSWIRTTYRHTKWREMIALEDQINAATLAGNQLRLEQGLAEHLLGAHIFGHQHVAGEFG